MTSSPTWRELADESLEWIEKLKAENDDLKARETYLKARESELKDRVKTLKTENAEFRAISARKGVEIRRLTLARDAAVSESIKLQKQLDNAKLMAEDYSKVVGTMQIMGAAQPHIDFTRPPKRMRVE